MFSKTREILIDMVGYDNYLLKLFYKKIYSENRQILFEDS